MKKLKVFSSSKTAKRKLKKGFTLIELLVVISILGLLASIIMVALGGTQSQARDGKRKAEVDSIRKALAGYYVDHGLYPKKTKLAPLENDPTLDGTTERFYDAVGEWLPTMPIDPLWGQIKTETGEPYSYQYKSNDYSTEYKIYTEMEEIASHEIYSSGVGSEFICGVINYAGQDYTTVQIGTQCWFQQNLNVGTKILSCDGGYIGVNPCSFAGQSAQSQGSDCGSIKKFCYHDNEANCASAGGLYQWGQAMCGSTIEGSQGICPAGWHIPTTAEYEKLKMYLASEVGDKLKASGLCQGRIPCDVFGFDALLAGYRASDGPFRRFSEWAKLWSSTQGPSGYWCYGLYATSFGVSLYSESGAHGFSVRCLKD